MTQPFDGLAKRQVIRIVGRSLACIDKRLIDHGERVAYIAGCIAVAGEPLDVDMDRLPVLCLLHDIGAYKTEEIDNMIHFETTNVTKHAIYGYVFLKNATMLGADALPVLYHHTPYEKLQALDMPHRTTAELIYLADRIDILLMSQNPVDWSLLRRLSGTEFSPALMERFFVALQKYDIDKHIRDGSYKEELLRWLDGIALTDEENVSYLKMLVYSIDFRSPFTVTHTANTETISLVLAQLLELSESEKRDILQGAFFHDIGKISIPYAILENPGKLTDEEMATMRTHVAVSEEILSGIVSDEVCQIAVRHHEKLNGKGYCHGLQANELTLPQRIVAVADILSALISRRSYKEPFPKEKTLSILCAMRDAGELCPRVCNTLIDHYDEVIDRVDRADDPIIELYETIQREYGELMA